MNGPAPNSWAKPSSFLITIPEWGRRADRIEVRFAGAKEAEQRLYALAQALMSDFERFEAPVGEERPSGECAGVRLETGEVAASESVPGAGRAGSRQACEHLRSGGGSTAGAHWPDPGVVGPPASVAGEVTVDDSASWYAAGRE